MHRWLPKLERAPRVLTSCKTLENFRAKLVLAANTPPKRDHVFQIKLTHSSARSDSEKPFAPFAWPLPGARNGVPLPGA